MMIAIFYKGKGASHEAQHRFFEGSGWKWTPDESGTYLLRVNGCSDSGPLKKPFNYPVSVPAKEGKASL